MHRHSNSLAFKPHLNKAADVTYQAGYLCRHVAVSLDYNAFMIITEFQSQEPVWALLAALGLKENKKEKDKIN